MDVEAQGDRIIIFPARPRYVLADLLKGITPQTMRQAFDRGPDRGREQRSPGPALVVSPGEFCRVTEFAIVCPITSRIRAFGTSVALPPGLPVSGEILTSHVRSIDTLARPISYAAGVVPAATLDEVRGKLAALIGL